MTKKTKLDIIPSVGHSINPFCQDHKVRVLLQHHNRNIFSFLRHSRHQRTQQECHWWNFSKSLVKLNIAVGNLRKRFVFSCFCSLLNIFGQHRVSNSFFADNVMFTYLQLWKSHTVLDCRL